MLLDTNNYLKNFYFANKKALTSTITTEFEKLNFIVFVGKDLYRRQIFLIDIDKLDFTVFEEKFYMNPLIIFVINCN